MNISPLDLKKAASHSPVHVTVLVILLTSCPRDQLVEWLGQMHILWNESTVVICEFLENYRLQLHDLEWATF